MMVHIQSIFVHKQEEWAWALKRNADDETEMDKDVRIVNVLCYSWLVEVYSIMAKWVRTLHCSIEIPNAMKQKTYIH
jgi:hypothetical protein